MKNNAILTITGPSLTGKTTLAQLIIQNTDNFEVVVAHTTRKPRHGEINGVHYNFVNKDEFLSMIKNNDLIEFAEVGPKDSKEFYGTSKKSLINIFNKNKNPLLVIEPEGANNLNKFANLNNYKIFQIFLNNPREILLQRLLERFKNDNLATSENYTKRLINMLDIEPVKWIEPALSRKQHYDLIIPYFNNNDDEVLKNILSNLNNFLTDNKRKLHI